MTDNALSITPDVQTVAAGQMGRFTVSCPSRAGLGLSTLSISGLPAGMTGVFNQNPASWSSPVDLPIHVAPGMASGRYEFTVVAVSGPLSHSATATLVVI